MTEERTKEDILRARARALAQEPDRQEFAEDVLPVVEFLLASERYAVEISRLREVYPLKELTPLPCTPPFVLGIINVRGQILPVLSLKTFFDFPAQGLTDLNKVLIVQTEDMVVGILADAILGARAVPLREMQPSLPTLTGIRADYLRGVTPERLIVLDMAAILMDRRILVQEEVAE